MTPDDTRSGDDRVGRNDRENPAGDRVGRDVRECDVPSDADDEYDVPSDADAVCCVRCDRPFVRERHLALHRELAHGPTLTEAEREAFEAARADERADIRHFRIVALGVLVLVYFGFLFAYALAT